MARDNRQVNGYGMENGAANQQPPVPYGAHPGWQQPSPQQPSGQQAAGVAPHRGVQDGQQYFPYGTSSGYGAAQPYGQPVYTHVNGQPAYVMQAPDGTYVVPQYVPPVTSQAPEEEKKRKRGILFWIILLLLLLCIAAACFFAFTMCQKPSERDGVLGQLDGKSAAEMQAELDRVVDEGMFNISIASGVEFADGTSPGALRIENVPGNRYLMQVVINVADTGQQIYESGILDPNHHIQEDTLDVDLPAGTYECIAHFHALDPETEEEVGEAAAKMTIVVLS